MFNERREVRKALLDHFQTDLKLSPEEAEEVFYEYMFQQKDWEKKGLSEIEAAKQAGVGLIGLVVFYGDRKELENSTKHPPEYWFELAERIKG